jgi:two-component system, cell cycle sensor histidine kinase and response regulator CckA
MSHTELIKLLLIEDDEDDFIITRDLLAEIPGGGCQLDWASSFSAGLEMAVRNQHDVCLVDYRLGAQNGVELLRAAIDLGCQMPMILLTGSGQHEIDLDAMQAGAADYLVKARLDGDSLERSIRYAIQRKRATALAAFEQARLAAFGAEVGLALTRRDSLNAILERCARAMAQYLNAPLAQICTFEPRKGVFEPRAHAGEIAEASHAMEDLPVLQLDPEAASEGKLTLIKLAGEDARVPDPAWAKRQRLVSCAAYPLMLEDKLVGLMTIYTRHALTDHIGQEMGSVANGIALCIERKRSEEALGVSEVKYRSVVENIKEVIFQLDEFGNWTFLNPAWASITGFDVEPTVGTFFLEYIYEDDRERNRHVFLQLIDRKLDYCRYETRFLTKDGRIRWVEVYAQLTLNTDGTILGASGSLTDVTERKLAEDQIQKLAAFPKVNPNPVLEFASNGSLTYANDAAREMAKSLGQNDLSAILPANAGDIARECLRTGDKRLREEICVQGRTIIWSFFPVSASRVVHCYGADVTEMLSLEAQFRHAQKLESVGQLAAGIAHDFNNILTVIQGYSDSLLARSKDDAYASSALKQVSDAARRAAALTRQLLTFSRKQMMQPRVLELNHVLRNLANMLPRLLGDDIALEADYAPDLERIDADAGMIEQVMMNLAVNARDAMPKGGKLVIATSNEDVDEAYCRAHPDSRAGRFACLRVTDSGCGMDRQTLNRIFEPFFSTKEVGKGTGLGLATVYGIVKQHQGWIEVASRVGNGTTFRIFLPAVTKAHDSTPGQNDGTGIVRGGRETVLLVEDEPVLREMVREVLTQYRYTVLEASCGAEALRIWDEHDGKIDLLLTDMVMPEGMTGRDLASQLKKRKPALKVIYSSGYSSEIMGKDFGQNDTAFLAKPYLPPQLAQKVRECLDARPRSHQPAALG